MSFAQELEQLMPETVSIEPLVSADALGVPTFGPPVSVRARIEAAVPKLTNAPDEQSAPRAVVLLAPRTTLGAEYALSPRARLTLPASYSPQQPKLLSAMPHNDEEGLHHYELHVLMRESALRRQITIEKHAVTGRSPSGQEKKEWLPVATVWADVRPVDVQGSGEDVTRTGQIAAWAVVLFRTEVFVTVDVKVPTPEFRVSYQGRSFDILDVRELGQREGLEIVAKARAE